MQSRVVPFPPHPPAEAKGGRTEFLARLTNPPPLLFPAVQLKSFVAIAPRYDAEAIVPVTRVIAKCN